MFKLRYSLFIFFCFVIFFQSKATHNRAGEITYKRIDPFTKVIGGVTVQVYTYSITVIKYTADGAGIADRCVDTIYFGDGERGIAPRINGGPSPCIGCQPCGCPNFGGSAVPCGSLIINDAGYKVKQNIYTIIHTYPGSGTYIIRTFDPNRNEGVHNIPNSINLPFYIESELVLNSFTGANSSPVFAFPPIDRACQGICFEHNPGAFDPDGDSLSYEISTSRGEDGQTVLGYFTPETGVGGSFGINSTSGLLTWCTPQYKDEYNIAFIVNEWRKNTSGVYKLIGYVLRDMQVIVNACPLNLPPQIIVPKEVCVEAGTLIDEDITVSDPNDGTYLTVEGGGGAFAGASPLATLTNTVATTFTATGGSFKAKFRWQTTCDHIRNQPYYTTFKAQDNGSPVKLVSFNTYVIRVVPPPVKNVTATPVGSTMKISWQASTCSPAGNPLTGYKIYRKDDCIPFTPDKCDNDIPSSSGFVLIAQTNASATFTIDNNNSNGLVVGQDYSYLVVAMFKDGTITFGSSQVCARLKRDVPVILNVTVDSTAATTGAVWVRWTKPLKTSGNFDTLAFPGPYQFNLKHRSGSTGTYTPVFNSTKNFLYQLDTSYVHKDINTVTDNHEYLVEFISGTKTTQTLVIGTSQVATSVFLNAVPSDRKIDLAWNFKTPWNNYFYKIYRKNPSATSFKLIDSTAAAHYSDTNNIANRFTYCYKILAIGKYSDTAIFKPLLNYSQEACATAKDLTPPCTPTLTIDADCPKGAVTVNWKDVRKICSDDVIKYLLFFKPTVNDVYGDPVLTNTLTSYSYDGALISGCYAIQSVDSSGNLSPLSPDFCIDNCPEFELPNIFTPNNDGVNDFYKAIKVYQIKEIDLSIVDRWDNLVYKTKDPYFKWDGVSIITKVLVSEGTFFYVCDVYEPRVKGIVKRNLKGWVEVQR